MGRIETIKKQFSLNCLGDILWVTRRRNRVKLRHSISNSQTRFSNF